MFNPYPTIVMEFLNEIRLRGVIGRAEINSYNARQVCNFSVVTEYVSADRDGNAVIDTTWFNISAWSGKEGIADLYSLQKGVWVEVSGRLRIRRYTTQDNEERSACEIVARTVRVVARENERMQPQRD